MGESFRSGGRAALIAGADPIPGAQRIGRQRQHPLIGFGRNAQKTAAAIALARPPHDQAFLGHAIDPAQRCGARHIGGDAQAGDRGFAAPIMRHRQIEQDVPRRFTQRQAGQMADAQRRMRNWPSRKAMQSASATSALLACGWPNSLSASAARPWAISATWRAMAADGSPLPASACKAASSRPAKSACDRSSPGVAAGTARLPSCPFGKAGSGRTRSSPSRTA